ncbi:acyltransferase [Cupriavidus necator]|uniref:acyltransferase family protein n=1 Tax=Cupriavidus necator TaxID=106590 RepID=UPI0039C46796
MPAHNEIRSLTGLRGIAALLVAIFHIHQPGGDGWLSMFFRHGYLAVDLFFVLSGFVMALTYGAMFREGFSWKPYGVFLGKRIARVYPLYLFITATMSVAVLERTAQAGHDVTFVVVTNLLMVQAWGLAPSLMPSTWSVSTEWAAYLLFPWLAGRLLYGRKAHACAWAGICAIGIAAVALANTGGKGPLDIMRYDSAGPVVRCIAGFSLGIVAYRVRSVPAIRQWLGNRFSATALWLAALGLMCLPGTDVVVVLLFPALVANLSLQSSRLSSLLGSRVIYTLGVWSYSFYLIHLPFDGLQTALAREVSPLVPWGASLLASAVCLSVALVLSALSYAGIERPSRSLLQSLLRPRGGKDAAEQRGKAISR